MINVSARRQARSIAKGNSHETAMPKVAYYGLLARMLSDEQLHTVQIPYVSSFNQLFSSLQTELTKQASRAYQDAPNDDKLKAEEQFAKYRGHARGEPGSLMGHITAHLGNGAMTAADQETATMRTIKWHLGDDSISEENLFGSGRVPIGINMLHLRGLAIERLSRENVMEWNSGDNGSVFGEDYVAYNHQKGLYLTNAVDKLIPGQASEDQPQIGCLAGLVPQYLQTVHEIAARSVMESGLLKVG